MSSVTLRFDVTEHCEFDKEVVREVKSFLPFLSFCVFLSPSLFLCFEILW